MNGGFYNSSRPVHAQKVHHTTHTTKDGYATHTSMEAAPRNAQVVYSAGNQMTGDVAGQAYTW